MTIATATATRGPKSGLIVVGISECKISNERDSTLITYSLGSCLGVAIHDPVLCIGGLIHCMLPLAKASPEKAAANPYMFVDTGVVALLNSMFAMGSQKEDLVVKVAGAAQFVTGSDRFKIGQRNYTVARKLMWKNDLLITAEDTGRTIPRTMCLGVTTGETIIKSLGKEARL
ncbi:MAG: chemotaxis protein CheD [Planctomycetota bacterium]|jgi:chemotaxis protein CheD